MPDFIIEILKRSIEVKPKIILKYFDRIGYVQKKFFKFFERGMRTKSWTPKRGDLWHIQSNKLLQH